MTNGVLLGLTAALFWGVADYCLRGATHAAGTFRALYFMQVVGLLALLLGVEVWRPLSFAHATPGLTLAAAALSLIILMGAALLYRSFAVGKLAVVSPIAASFGAITTILALLSGERPTVLQLVGLALLLVGVVLSGIAPTQPDDMAQAIARQPGAERRWLGPGVAEALGATVLFGGAYWAMRYVVGPLGGVQTAMIGKATDLVALTVVVLAAWASRRFVGAVSLAQGVATPEERALAPRSPLFWRWLIPGAILDTAANVAYNFGVTGALTSVVATLSSLFTAVTVVLAWIFLRERLTRVQWSGVLFILAGIALVNL
ncbi:MAG TPA: DMT family transporter [Ktedonobacterales bacterium]|nr:DMT family transporter [Ktedonobacterales bacterium]